MGWKLAEAALDNMPPELTSGERCVVHAIAWSIKDATGEGWVTEPTLLQRSGLSARGIRKALERLAERGHELRIAIDKDKHGQPIYAHRGQARQFRFPREWRPTEGGTAVPPSDDGQPVDNSKNGGTPVPVNNEKGGTAVPERRYPSTGKAVPQYRPRGHGGHGGNSGAVPPIGTRHAPDCSCHGSGLEENDDGMPTGRPCPVTHLRAVTA